MSARPVIQTYRLASLHEAAIARLKNPKNDIVMLLILFAIIMVGIPQAYDFYTQDPLGIPVLIVVVLFAATGSVIIYKMADIDVE